mmetsp:Transcript_125720/g.352105  ORF Transcript_125720/g.352105 Transcript_125720/m.352105 type:complete len:392 (-) Transcript_125720:249-1424(-)
MHLRRRSLQDHARALAGVLHAVGDGGLVPVQLEAGGHVGAEARGEVEAHEKGDGLARLRQVHLALPVDGGIRARPPLTAERRELEVALRLTFSRNDAPDVEVDDLGCGVHGGREPLPQHGCGPGVRRAGQLSAAGVFLAPSEDVGEVVRRAQGHLHERGEALNELVVRPDEAVARVHEVGSLGISREREEHDEQGEGAGAVAAARDQPRPRALGARLVLRRGELHPEDVQHATPPPAADHLDDIEHAVLVVGRGPAHREDVHAGHGPGHGVEKAQQGHVLPGDKLRQAGLHAVAVRHPGRAEGGVVLPHRIPGGQEVRLHLSRPISVVNLRLLLDVRFLCLYEETLHLALRDGGGHFLRAIWRLCGLGVRVLWLWERRRVLCGLHRLRHLR